MRDIKRIPKVLQLILGVWLTMPDLRFFQFILYLQQVVSERTKKKDLFFLEDDELLNILSEILNEA